MTYTTMASAVAATKRRPGHTVADVSGWDRPGELRDELLTLVLISGGATGAKCAGDAGGAAVRTAGDPIEVTGIAGEISL